MSNLPWGDPTSRGVQEDILVPLHARLTAISTLIDSASASPPAGAQRGPPPPPDYDAGDAKLRASALLEKVRREVFQLEDVFRRIDDTEKRIRYSFDPVEKQLDDALQHDPPDAERIHAGLLAVDAGISDIKATIRGAYNIACDDGGRVEGMHQQVPAPSHGTATGAVGMTKKMGEIRHGSQMSHLMLTVGALEARLLGCVLCLAAFPDGAVIKKRLLFHWWLAEGFVRSTDEGKSRFDELIAKGFIIAAPTALCGSVHRCTVRPWMRDLLLTVARRNGFLELNAGDVEFARRACLRGDRQASGFSAAVRAIYNIGQKYVELNERWFAGKKDLRVLQLGQWREFSTAQQIASPMDSHIEVSGVERFRDMESCKNLRYVSFRGISRIESLPTSIGKLRQLQVLDLRACHNLEELGQGITKLNRLEYLDLSECHLLVGMPKGLGQLTRLQILKGFVVANSNSGDFCHLNELTKLEKLRKLGIVVGRMAVPVEDEFLKLGEFKSLESLRLENQLGCAQLCQERRHRCSIPPSLGGDDEVRPSSKSEEARPPLFPVRRLCSVGSADGREEALHQGWKAGNVRRGRRGMGAEVLHLRLRFLSDLHCDHGRLRRLFRNLEPENTEIHQCPNFIRGGMDHGMDDTEESAETHSEVEETDTCNEIAV